MKIFLRVTLCITIIAFSISLPQCALGMPLWQHAAICDQCSNPSVAITQFGITWLSQVTLDSFKQNTATSCLKCPPRHAHVHAPLTYGDLKPPWIKFDTGNNGTYTATQQIVILYISSHHGGPQSASPQQLSPAASTSKTNRYTTNPPGSKPPTPPPSAVVIIYTTDNVCCVQPGKSQHNCTHQLDSNQSQKSATLLYMHPNTAFSLTQSLSKDRLQLHASWVHISGFTGDPEAMHTQLQQFQDTHLLPLTLEAHHILDQEVQNGPNDKFGHAVDGQVLSTHSKRSILFPLQYETAFAPNPDSAVTHGAHEQLVFPLRLVSRLPAPAGYHGRMPTLIAQPWFVDPEAELQLISRLFGFTKLHCQCQDDIYATCLLRIQASFQRHQCTGINFVQLLWHTPAVPQAKQQKSSKPEQHSRSYPNTLYVYLVASPEINLHTFALQEALPPQGRGYQLLDFYPCLQLVVRGPIAAAHIARRPPDATCWLMLLDVRQVPLHYIHQLLLSVGLSPHAIMGIAYTANGGVHVPELVHPNNVLIHLSSQHDLDRIADHWFGAEATNLINNGTRSLCSVQLV